MGRRPGLAAAVSRWALGGLSPGELGRRLYRRSREDEILERAAALSYYFVFALLPTLLFLTTLLGLLPTPDLMPQLLSYVDRVLPRDAASLLKRTLAEVVTGASGGLLSIGVLAAILGASSGMLSIMAALNAAYGVTDNRTTGSGSIRYRPGPGTCSSGRSSRFWDSRASRSCITWPPRHGGAGAGSHRDRLSRWCRGS